MPASSVTNLLYYSVGLACRLTDILDCYLGIGHRPCTVKILPSCSYPAGHRLLLGFISLSISQVSIRSNELDRITVHLEQCRKLTDLTLAVNTNKSISVNTVLYIQVRRQIG